MMHTVRVQATQNVDVDYPLAGIAKTFGIESDLLSVKHLYTLLEYYSRPTPGK